MSEFEANLDKKPTAQEIQASQKFFETYEKTYRELGVPGGFSGTGLQDTTTRFLDEQETRPDSKSFHEILRQYLLDEGQYGYHDLFCDLHEFDSRDISR